MIQMSKFLSPSPSFVQNVRKIDKHFEVPKNAYKLKRVKQQTLFLLHKNVDKYEIQKKFLSNRNK